jgi:hypothetical protein
MRKVGDHGQCEAHDLVPTEDDAVDVRCHRPGRCILGNVHDRQRLRFVCGLHGYASAMEVN